VLLELDWSPEDEAGGSAASTGPAIKARAMTGTSFLNIDVVSEKVMGRASFVLGRCLPAHAHPLRQAPLLSQAPRSPGRAYYHSNPSAQASYDRNVMLAVFHLYLIDNKEIICASASAG
jgi:hypothetical protein